MRTLAIATILAAALAVGASGADLPRPAPELTIKLPGGSNLQLSQYRGKVVALEFLLTTCPHCQRSSKALNKLQQEYAARGFQVLGVAINPMSNMLVPDYVKQFQLTFPVGYDVPETANNFLQIPVMYRMLMPQVAFIDRNGTIRAQYSGDDPFFQNEDANMRAKIEELLKESPAAKQAAPAKKAASPGKVAAAK
jgi:peroxiredoxin